MENFVVKVFGSEYNIRADRDGEYVLKVAEIVDRKMRALNEQYRQPAPLRTAVLACMNLVDESIRRREAETEWVRGRVKTLIEKLEKVI